MYLQRLIERNPGLLEGALMLHQKGHIPPNTWVIDLDAVVENARVLAGEAHRLGLTTYVMSKQYGRNPYVSLLALAQGLHKMVAVDVACALQLRRYSIPVGHLGHLNQIPRRHVAEMVALAPEVITVYNVDHAHWIAAAAAAQGRVQDVLLRVIAPGDIFFAGQEGGVREEDLPAVARSLAALGHVRLVGVTSFPCLRYNHRSDEPAEVTPNLHTILRAAATLRQMGCAITQINAPGNTSAVMLPLLARHGATHVEPGHGLLGTTPPHAFQATLPERPAYVYVTEVSHHVGDRAYAFGGGLFHDGAQPDRALHALVGTTWAQSRENRVDYVHGIPQIIDYHAVLEPGDRCRVGDTVLLGFRTQMQMTRSYVAPVSGLSGRSEIRLHHLFDHAATALDNSFNPIAPSVVRRAIDTLIATYA